MPDVKSNYDPVLAIINTSQNHPNVVYIKQREFNTIFNFINTNKNEVSINIKNLKVCKFCQGYEIPTKITKFNIDLFRSFIFRHFNYCISTGEFSNELKHAEAIRLWNSNKNHKI